MARLLEHCTPPAKISRLSLGVKGLLRRLQQLSLKIVSDDSMLLAIDRLASTAARLVVATLSNGVDSLTRHALDGGQRSEVHVEQVMNSALRAVAVGSSVLDGRRSVGSELVLVILRGRKVQTVCLRPGVEVQGVVGLADEAVSTWNLARSRKYFELDVRFAHLVREHSCR